MGLCGLQALTRKMQQVAMIFIDKKKFISKIVTGTGQLSSVRSCLGKLFASF
jgi:hypothetical protein